AAAVDAARRADRLVEGRYDLLGYRDLSFAGSDGRVDWHLDPVHGRRAPRRFFADVPYLDPAIGDHKIIWELNRHQHWLALARALWLTGQPRHARAILRELAGWLDDNPPLVGINWASMLEIALRAISWTWALHALVGSRAGDPDGWPWLVDMLVALDRQLAHVEENLSYYFSPNTHLTGEALGLYVAATALPELAASGRWAALGRRILLDEAVRQILPDGGHAERSAHYHRYTLDFYLLALLTAERARDGEAALPFREAVSRLATFARALADDDGRLPLIGDDDGGMLWPLAGRACRDVRDSLALAAVVLDRPELAPWGVPEEVFWLAGLDALDRIDRIQRAAGPAPVPSHVFPDTGFVVMRDRTGTHLVLDGGRHGYMNGGHAHADALILTLAIGGRPVLIDPGTSTYTMDARIRDALRRGSSHNTLALDGRSSAEPAGPFHWRTQADGRLHGWRHNPRFDWVEASHDGYAPAVHRRTIVRRHTEVFVIDEVLGSGPCEASVHWHFDPAWTLHGETPGRLLATSGDAAVWLLYDGGAVTLVRGDAEAGLGWYAPVYGTLAPTWTVRVTRRAAAPLAMITWIRPRGSPDEAPRVERVDGGVGVVGARAVYGMRQSLLLVRPGPGFPDAAPACRIGEIETDARVAHLAREGDLLLLDLVDASRAAAGGAFTLVAGGGRFADLHISLSTKVIELTASSPPPDLRLHGRALRTVTLVKLNGRPIPPDRDSGGGLTIAPSAWERPAEPLRSPSPAA
ncbi:MAG TPA: alginate lyase family protein, partial [Vicinamibacterales bacterium]|nr:alginate lyase family protein [Vicinamibacterales bacterium]